MPVGTYKHNCKSVECTEFLLLAIARFDADLVGAL